MSQPHGDREPPDGTPPHPGGGRGRGAGGGPPTDQGVRDTEGEATEDLPDELRTWCKETLQRYQWAQIVEFVEDSPRTATGKIQRFKLRAESEKAEALLR